MKIDDDSMKSFGERVRQRRLELGLSQEELGKRTNLSQQAITKIEKRNNGSKYITKLASALNVSPEWLETGEDIPKKAYYNIGISEWENLSSVAKQQELILKDNYIYLKTIDDSMTSDGKTPSFPSDTIIIIDPSVTPELGRFVIAKHRETKDILFRRYSKMGIHPKLMALNPLYEPYLAEDFEIIGVVIASMNLDL